MDSYNKLLTDHDFFEKNKKWTEIIKSAIFRKFSILRSQSKNKFYLRNKFGIVYLTAIKQFNYFIILNYEDEIIAKVNRIRFTNNFDISLCNKIGNQQNDIVLYGKRLKSKKHPFRYYLLIPSINLHKKYKNKLLKDFSKYPNYYINNTNKNYKNYKKYNSNIIYAIYKSPKYHKYRDCYTLNFINKKIKYSSVKNFQITVDDKIIFEFGKVYNDIYNLIFKQPFSIIQAFGLALTTFN